MILKLKTHNRRFNEFTEIDKFVLVPKKAWDDLPQGITEIMINNQKEKIKIFDVPCNCTGQIHSHKIIDLRDIWEKLKLENDQKIEIGK